MTRRSALAMAAAASLGARPPQLRFGFSLYGMKSMPAAEAAGLCARIGYKAVEVALMPGWDTEPKQFSPAARKALREKLRDLDLTLPAVMDNLKLLGTESERRANLERLKAAAGVAHEVSPGPPAVVETILGGRPAEWEQSKQAMAGELRVWAGTLAPLKTVVAIKPHVSGAMDRPEKALWLLDQVSSPWVKLVYDYSHFQLHKLDMRQTMRQLAGRAVFAHIKDSEGEAGKFRFLLPGDGSTDYKAYVQALTAAGYRGAVVVEVSSQVSNQPGYDPAYAARHCYEKVAPAFA
ncbi:MAG TPA: sugar phosphate isomerase/epimerase [Bryobacteraceae bacterium]|nr:sugar phosphate isomerase/epimerase [Bryobacteraceae bacterium]